MICMLLSIDNEMRHCVSVCVANDKTSVSICSLGLEMRDVLLCISGCR